MNLPKTNLNSQTKESKKKYKYECANCDYKTSSLKMAEAHKQMHIKNNPYKLPLALIGFWRRLL
jgi:hypothetical protein